MSEIYTVLDIETTGFSAAFMSEIIEVGAYHTDGKNILDEFHMYIKPYRKVSQKITDLTGITNEMLEDKDNKWKVLPKLSNFIKDTIVVAHNAEFDINFINICFYHLNLPLINKYICTQSLFKNNNPSSKKSNLEHLCSVFEITNESAHSALCDAKATTEVFIKMFERYNVVPTTYSEQELICKTLKRIVNGRPYVNIKKELCLQPTKNYGMLLPENEIISLLYKGKTPLEICNICSNDYHSVNKVFIDWLNPLKCTRYYGLINNKTVNDIAKKIISISNTFDEVIELHNKIFEEPANEQLYSILWTLNKENLQFKYEYRDFLWHFDQGKTILKISSEFKISPYLVADFFVEYAIKNKTDNTKRNIIASKLCTRSELAPIVKEDEYINKLITKPTEQEIKKYLSYELYKKNFFSINLENTNI